jgi:hypothetical protein
MTQSLLDLRLASTSSVICQSRNSERLRASRRTQTLMLISTNSLTKMMKMLTNQLWMMIVPNIAKLTAWNAHTKKSKQKKSPEMEEDFRAIPPHLTGDSKE